MQIPVLVEPVANNGYRARGMEPFSLSAEGATRAEAVANLEKQLQARLKNGSTVVTIEVATKHPLAEFAGMFADDPDFQDVLKIMEENRRSLDQDASVP